MKKIYSICFSVALTISPLFVAGENSVATSEATSGVPAEQIEHALETMEYLRGFKDAGFSFTSEVLTVKEQKVIAKHLLEVKVSDQGFAMVETLAPKIEEGRRTLMRKNDLWLFIPSSSNVIRIAPLQRVFGSASIADVLNTSFLNGYTVDFTTQTSAEIVVIQLISNSKSATYAGITLHYNLTTNQPIKTEHFTASGRLLKTIEYKSFVQHQGQLMVEKIAIYDSLREDSSVWIKMSGYERNNHPAALFTKSGLKKA